VTGSRGKRWIVTVAPILLMLLALLGLAARDEARASWLQARYFTHQASQLTSEVGDGPSDRIRFPGDGPHDRRGRSTGRRRLSSSLVIVCTARSPPSPQGRPPTVTTSRARCRSRS